jgi:hypothetical protein
MQVLAAAAGGQGAARRLSAAKAWACLLRVRRAQGGRGGAPS